MENSDWKAFRGYLGGVYEQYGKSAPTDAGARIMFEALRDMDLETVLAGISRHVQTNRFMPPNAAAVREAVFGVAEDRAILAFDKVLDALKIVNSGDSVKFDDPCIHFALKQCRGWTGFCHMDEADSRRLFLSAYAAAYRSHLNWQSVDDHLKGEREERGSVLDPWTPDQIVNVAALAANAGQKRITA